MTRRKSKFFPPKKTKRSEKPEFFADSEKHSLWGILDQKVLRNQKRQSGANQQFTIELRQAAALMSDKKNSVERVWRHLERAHILGQSSPIRHTAVHVVMFAFAVLTRDVREGVGQILRMLLAAPGSLFGFAPRGNSGRTGAGLFAPMPIPVDLQKFLEK